MLTASFLRQVESAFSKHFKSIVHVKRVTPVSGGSINLTARVDTTKGLFFLKVNDAFRYPDMFQKESKGLKVLYDTKTFKIPEVILTGEDDAQAFLAMEFIESRNRSDNFWKKFGSSLASLHKNTNDKFGFVEDNYIGSLKQSNRQHNKWIDFFIEERLEPQLKLAYSKGLLNEKDKIIFQKIFSKLDELIPYSEPSLLHGDLWNGNFLSGYSGEPCLIDPAVYYGHREMDLAMTKMFGGFEEEFYQSYNENYPLEEGFEDRVALHNLYPLLVHVNLFGGGYVNDVRNVVKKFAG
jgi:protein-ribulosamine 3-kinase